MATQCLSGKLFILDGISRLDARCGQRQLYIAMAKSFRVDLDGTAFSRSLASSLHSNSHESWIKQHPRELTSMLATRHLTNFDAMTKVRSGLTGNNRSGHDSVSLSDLTATTGRSVHPSIMALVWLKHNGSGHRDPDARKVINAHTSQIGRNQRLARRDRKTQRKQVIRQNSDDSETSQEDDSALSRTYNPSSLLLPDTSTKIGRLAMTACHECKFVLPRWKR